MTRAVASLLLLAAAAPPRSLDLAGPFGARSPWRLTLTQGPDIPDPIMGDGALVPGPVRACLSRDDGRTCSPELTDALRLPGDPDPYAEPHEVQRIAIVRPRAGRPLLLVRLASLPGANGNQRIVTQLFGYDRAGDRFRLAYQRRVRRNNNEEVRYLDRGPLAGAVIAAEPTQDAPFAYWISVDRLAGETYRPVLRYRSATRYGDGNPLAVIDAEMPAIQRRLGLWRPGRPLPLPARPCPQPRLIRGALWCGPAG